MSKDVNTHGIADRRVSAHKVDAGTGERLHYAGMEFVIRASAESTGGAFSVIEEINPFDAPMHVHEEHDELFYVLEGRHVVTVGDTEYELGPGDVVFGPRGVPHSQRRVVPRTGRMLTMFSPAGFEGFFRDLAAADREGEVDADAMDRLVRKYGTRWV